MRRTELLELVDVDALEDADGLAWLDEDAIALWREQKKKRRKMRQRPQSRGPSRIYNKPYMYIGCSLIQHSNSKAIQLLQSSSNIVNSKKEKKCR